VRTEFLACSRSDTPVWAFLAPGLFLPPSQTGGSTKVGRPMFSRPANPGGSIRKEVMSKGGDRIGQNEVMVPSAEGAPSGTAVPAEDEV
jgi:hypothetical protein